MCKSCRLGKIFLLPFSFRTQGRALGDADGGSLARGTVGRVLRGSVLPIPAGREENTDEG